MSSKAHQRLCRALHSYISGARIRDTRERPWASITFEGAQHWLTLEVPTAAAAAALARALPEADLPIQGHIVADLAVVRQEVCPVGVALFLEVLTVDAC